MLSLPGDGPLDSRSTALRGVKRRAETGFSGVLAPPECGGHKPTQGSLAQVGLLGFFGAVQAGLPVAWAATRVLSWGYIFERRRRSRGPALVRARVNRLSGPSSERKSPALASPACSALRRSLKAASRRLPQKQRRGT